MRQTRRPMSNPLSSRSSNPRGRKPGARRRSLLQLTLLPVRSRLAGLVLPVLLPSLFWCGPAPAQTPRSDSAPASDVTTTAPATTDGQPTFEFRGGRWIPVESAEAPTTQATDVVLDTAEDYLRRGGWRAARELLLEWFKTHDKRARFRDRATFLLAEVYFQSGNRILSFYHFDEVLDLYPESRLYTTALQRQYDIADAFLNGYRQRVFGLPILTYYDEAIEILYRIQNRAPGSQIAEKGLLRTADYYYATSQFDFAADTYGFYVKAYPRSPLVPRVRLRQAFSQMAQFRGVRFDATPAIDARESLSDLIITQPELAGQESLPSVVRRIDEALARKLLVTADYYTRTDQTRGAVYLLRLLDVTYPDSADAAEARRRLALFTPDELSDPAPTTRPVLPGSVDEFAPPVPPSPAAPPASDNARTNP